MRAKKRQMMSLLFALVFAVSLIGCKGETNEDKQEQLTNIEEQQGEEQQGTEVAQSDEKTDEVVEEVMPENQNLLTGLADLSDKAIGKRPVAIMVNNVNDALPQYGIAGADVIFEMHVEGDLTRLMALYADYTEIPKVCAIRSCRYYFPAIAHTFGISV